MDSLAPAALLPPTPAGTEVLSPLQTRERLLVPERRGPAGGIEDDASQTRLCMCPGYYASKESRHYPPPRGLGLTPQGAGLWKSLEMLVLGTPALIRNALC